MPDPRSAAREAVARAALAEFTAAGDVGDLLEEQTSDDGLSTLSFATTQLGYPGWRWTVAVAELPGEEPTVLEAELLPNEGALLAPDWVPWSERLEEYRAAQAAAAEANAESAAEDDAIDEDDDLDDVDELDKPGVDLRELIDFEPDDEESPTEAAPAEKSAPTDDRVGEQDEADAESADADPEPVAVPGRRQSRKRAQQPQGGQKPEA